MQEFHYVYLTTNLINGHQYVGDRTCNVEPKKDNYIGSGILFNKKKKEYGQKNFKKLILEQFSTREKAYYAQEKYIKLYNTLVPNGYNISPTGGFGFIHGHHSNESRLKISINSKGKNTGKKHTKEQNQQHSECLCGRKQSDESNKKRSKSLSGKPKSEQHKQNLKGKNTGKKHTKEQNRNHSIAMTGEGNPNFGKPHSEEHNKKISKGNTGKKRSPETIQKLSDSHKGLKQSEEHVKSRFKKRRDENDFGVKIKNFQRNEIQNMLIEHISTYEISLKYSVSIRTVQYIKKQLKDESKI